MLHITSVNYYVGGRTIFQDASGHVPAGQRVGLVGGNGSGKTTLLRLITGELELVGGQITQRKQCTLGTVSQDAPGGAGTPLQVVLESDHERNRLLQEAEQTGDPERLAFVHERLVDIDAHSAPARAAVILSGLGFSEEAQSRPLREFSGGWRMRVALASALFQAPDLLLLDEPTNHLDLEAIMWLEAWLRQYPGTLLLVSHDQDLLNTVVDNILLVKDGTLSFFSGNYDAFVRAQSEREAHAEAAAAKQEAARKHLQSFVDRFRAKATKAKQAQSRVKALEKMSPVLRSVSRGGIQFRFPAPDARPSPLVKFDGASVGYVPGQPILNELHLSIFNDDRIALLGQNGNGKSTMARLLAGELLAESGEVVRAGKLVIGYFAQDHLEQLDLELTALDQVAAHMPDAAPQAVRDWLGRFGFGQERAEVRVRSLSGGEKTRLALSLVALTRPNLMILDEPTNHLDVDARRALVDGLNQFDGAIILISHDRQLIETTCEQLWLVKGGTCAQYFGDMDEYRALLVSERGTKAKQDGAEKQRGSRKADRREAAQNRAVLAPLKKRARDAEAHMEKLAGEKDDMEALMSDPGFYGKPEDEVVRITARFKELQALLESAEEEWLEAGEALESASE